MQPSTRTGSCKSCESSGIRTSSNWRHFTIQTVNGCVPLILFDVLTTAGVWCATWAIHCLSDLSANMWTEAQKDEVYLNLVLEFVPETVYRASRYFNKLKTTMPILEVKLYIYQLFRSLAYIHSQGICHRDIKPQNLLLDPNSGILKLCDFGSAKILVENEPNVSYICSRYYRAPELIFGATNYTTKIGKHMAYLQLPDYQSLWCRLRWFRTTFLSFFPSLFLSVVHRARSSFVT